MVTDLNRPQALLIIGPAGSGKTPLGDALQRRGLWGMTCLHFDFGRTLRRVAADQDRPPRLSGADVDVVRRVLGKGDLLENNQFHIARACLEHFLGKVLTSDDDRDALVVLNGLPRHAGQARDLEPLLRVVAVVVLDCPPAVARRRIRTNAGGDRTGRDDDEAPLVQGRHEQFRSRTLSLAAYYRDLGAPVRQLDVEPNTTAESLRGALEKGGPPPALTGTGAS
jgi:adenylate kinase family enzyme